jgi:predicted lipoprotein
MRMIFVVLGLSALLSACAPSQDAAAPTPTPAISSMAPGQYRTTVTFAGAQPMSDEQCVAQTEIADLVRNSIPAQDAAACSENTINTANGRIEGRIVCLDTQGAPRTLDVAGAYGSSRADMTLTVTASENGRTVTQQGTAVIERVGECGS